MGYIHYNWFNINLKLFTGSFSPRVEHSPFAYFVIAIRVSQLKCEGFTSLWSTSLRCCPLTQEIFYTAVVSCAWCHRLFPCYCVIEQVSPGQTNPLCCSLCLCVCPRWSICSTVKFRIGSCSRAATWSGTWAARTATANWAGSMSLPPRTASATRRAASSWSEPWSGRARASRSTFHPTIPEEAPAVSSQVLFNWNSNVIKSTKKSAYIHCHLSIRVGFMDYKVGKIVKIFQMEPYFLYSFYILLSLQQLFVERMLCRCCNFFSLSFTSVRFEIVS